MSCLRASSRVPRGPVKQQQQQQQEQEEVPPRVEVTVVETPPPSAAQRPVSKDGRGRAGESGGGSANNISSNPRHSGKENEARAGSSATADEEQQRKRTTNRRSLMQAAKERGGSSGVMSSLLGRTNRVASEDFSQMGRKVFSDFLIKCMAHDVLEFWDLTSEYVANCRKKVVSEAAAKLAHKMITEFILPDAPQKMDLGYTVDAPLLEAYCLGKYSLEQFDPVRLALWKLLQGLRMDANMTFGVKSNTSQAIAKFLESEERKMHQLKFQRDVNPMIRMLRKSLTER